jgi:hypothetical protein
MDWVNLDADALGECVFALVREWRMFGAPVELTPEILLLEQAAQEALLDACEGRAKLGDAPAGVRALAIALMTQFLHNLGLDPAYRSARWSVPAGASPTDQARFALAAEIRRTLGRAPSSH